MSQKPIGILGTFLFGYRMRDQQVGSLSGGERSRLSQLARLMIGGANCLVLDEPTNHLDIASAEVLENALAGYAGTVIVISHDRYFLDRVVDEVLEVKDGGLTSYPGGYSDYMEQKQAAAAPPVPQIIKGQAKQAVAAKAPARAEPRGEQRAADDWTKAVARIDRPNTRETLG